MFRLFGDSAAAPLGASERAAVQRLCESRSELLLDGLVTDVKSEVGYMACTSFLESIEAAAQALGLRPAARGYRSNFTANYRALFPDGDRRYRVDVLEASVDQQFDIWVNGQKFELDEDAIDCAQALQREWLNLIEALDRWVASDQRLGRPELSSVMGAVDVAWAAFEQRYIGALIAIEEQARQLVVRAVELERQLPRDPAAKPSPQVAEIERTFVECIAHLNSIANHKGRGRDDLKIDILEGARVALRGEPGARRGQDAADILAGDVIASYAAIRGYMRKVSSCLEHVDPHLCNNAGLVSRLVDYEESWEVGARYVRLAPMLGAICDVFAEVREAERLAPELSAMIEDCDVELFMVLPRLVVLGFLSDPREARVELVRSLLPHRFGPAGDGASMKVDPELKALYGRYKETAQLLAGCAPPAGLGCGGDTTSSSASTAASTPGASPSGAGAAASKAALVRQAVGSSSGDELPAEAQRAARELLLAVETFSLELQRRSPEDWNQCSAILVRCLTGGATAREQSKFTV